MCHGEPGGCRDRILQGGLWGLWQRLWELARGKKSDNEEDDGNAAANPGAAKGGHA